jgi:hypothetical protein
MAVVWTSPGDAPAELVWPRQLSPKAIDRSGDGPATRGNWRPGPPRTSLSNGDGVESFQPMWTALGSGTGFPPDVNVFARIASWGPPDS